MLRRLALVRTDVSEVLSASFIRVTRIGECLVTLMNEALNSSETLVLTRANWRNIPEDSILRSHNRENSSITGLFAAFIWDTQHVGKLDMNPFCYKSQNRNIVV
jgi:hypothetical protein